MPQRTTKKKSDPQLGKPASRSNSKDASDRENTPSSETNSKSNGSSSASPIGLEFLTLGRPVWDLHREYDEERMEEMSEEELEKLDKEHNAAKEKVWRKKPEEAPDCIWIKRDVERVGMYFYNDTYGYGIDEVIKIHFKAFATEFKKASPSTGKLWSYIESFAWLFVHHVDELNGVWAHIDDGEGVSETAGIICLAILAMLNPLEKEKLVDAVPNVGVILAIYTEFLTGHADSLSCARTKDVEQYPAMIHKLADKLNIKITGPYDFTPELGFSKVADLKQAQLKLIEKPAAKDKFNFVKHWNEFARQRIGGFKIGPSNYDITKMTKKERIEASFDGKDPLEKMKKAGPIPSSGIY
ncbi:hypothetical protein M501DRAFT_1015999 [Patellaria atrata CBS 101060]|uniref:Uncharacterized protein n=1 Tax=Patellaria atrata CBS 101060 TaxID=1346257 RepID=A0A9P4SDS4_9PEZI|nr:hypothetical protein M501DRAFT_1015999 [Patellaria atrata CBS 101060]